MGRREDPQPRVPACLRCVDEDRLGEPDLERERLQQLLGNRARVREDGQLIPSQGDVREHIGDDIAERGHDVRLVSGRSGIP